MGNSFEKGLAGGDKENMDVDVLEKEPESTERVAGVSSETIKQEQAADSLKKESGLKEVRESIGSDKGAETKEAANKKEQEEARLVALAKDKIGEMQAELDKNTKGFLGKMFLNKGEVGAANLHLKEAKELLDQGNLPDMESLKRHVKFAQGVDVSEFPKSKKKLSSFSGVGSNLAR
jgi:hypothetical protein